MADLDPVVAEMLQPELLSGESLYWTGQPSTSVVFHKEDFFLIPFSLMWGGFAIFWESAALGIFRFDHPKNGDSASSLFMSFWGIPFVVVGQYLIWGRFFVTAWLKRRTFYGVTNQRVLVVQNGWTGKMASAFLENLPCIAKEQGSNGIGILRFTPDDDSGGRRNKSFNANGMHVGSVPVFIDINDVDSVYRLISDLKSKTKSPDSQRTSQFVSPADFAGRT